MAFFDDIKKDFKSYFNLTPYFESEQEARQSIIEGVSFRGPNIIILILAIFIASLGLNTNSPAVIIGAMLISPLMGPIIGIGLGVGTYDFPLIKRCARNLAMAALFSVLTSTLYFLISPVSEGHSELLARTSPTIYDVLIGFFGGGAGIVAIACKQKGNVIPGVAIATALMPPLCTAGYGIATMQLHYFYGAFYLFLINCIFIALATLIGVKLFKFKVVTFVDDHRKRRVKKWVYTIVTLTILPSIYLTVIMIRDSFFINDADLFVEQEFVFPNTQVFSKKAYVKRWKKYLNVNLIGDRLNIDSLRLAMETKMNNNTFLRGTNLTITQGFGTSSASNINNENSSSTSDKWLSAAIDRIEQQKNTIDSLRQTIYDKENFDSLSYTIAPEIKVLYPDITYIAINRTFMCNTDTRQIDTVNVAVIENSKPLRDLPTVRKYLETRTGLKNIHIIQSTLPLK